MVVKNFFSNPNHWHLLKPGMEYNKMECFVTFQFLIKKKRFDLGLEIPKSKFLESREILYSMALG